MIIFDPIRDFIRNLDRRELLRWGGAYITLSIFVVIVILVRHVILLKDIKAKIVLLNKSRTGVQEILTKFQVVDQQKNKVVEALNRDKKFKIQIFFQTLGTKLPAARSVVPKFLRTKLASGYWQESLGLDFSQIDTKELCELLQDIENEPLVYVIFVDITRVSHAKKFNVSMSIATLTAEE